MSASSVGEFKKDQSVIEGTEESKNKGPENPTFALCQYPALLQASDLRIHDFNFSTEYKLGVDQFPLQMGMTLNCDLNGQLGLHSTRRPWGQITNTRFGHGNPHLRVLEIGDQGIIYGSGCMPSKYHCMTHGSLEIPGCATYEFMPYPICGITFLGRRIVFAPQFMPKPNQHGNLCLYQLDNHTIAEIDLGVTPILGASEGIAPLRTLGDRFVCMRDSHSFKVMKWDEEKAHGEWVFAWSCEYPQVTVTDNDHLTVSFSPDARSKSAEWKFAVNYRQFPEKVQALGQQLVDLNATYLVSPVLHLIASYIIDIESELLITRPDEQKPEMWPLIQHPEITAMVARNPNALFSRTLRCLPREEMREDFHRKEEARKREAAQAVQQGWCRQM